jgi:hypothetical protein
MEDQLGSDRSADLYLRCLDRTTKYQYKSQEARLNLSSKYSQLGHRWRCPAVRTTKSLGLHEEGS